MTSPLHTHAVPAQYSVVAETQNATEDSRFTVVLDVMANPTPTDEQTTWTFNGGTLGENITVTFKSITFDGITKAHDGVYTVSSTTVAGTSIPLNFNLNVLCELQLELSLIIGH